MGGVAAAAEEEDGGVRYYGDVDAVGLVDPLAGVVVDGDGHAGGEGSEEHANYFGGFDAQGGDDLV